MCMTGKVEHDTPNAAIRVLKRMTERHSNPKAKKAGWATGTCKQYKCARCGKWHVGHKAGSL